MLDELCDHFFSHHFAIDAEALAEVLEVRGGVEADLVSRFLQHARK